MGSAERGLDTYSTDPPPCTPHSTLLPERCIFLALPHTHPPMGSTSNLEPDGILVLRVLWQKNIGVKCPRQHHDAYGPTL